MAQEQASGCKGNEVNVSIFRKGRKDLLDFTITRDKIPYNSLDAAICLIKRQVISDSINLPQQLIKSLIVPGKLRKTT